MTIFFRFLVTVFVLVGGALVLPAQQDAAVAIAEKIPQVGTTVNDFVGCVERLVLLDIERKEAMKNCLKATGKQTKIASDISDDASGANKSNRPLVVSNGWGYGGWGGSYYRRGGYYGGGGVTVINTRSQPVNQAAPTTQVRPQGRQCSTPTHKHYKP